MLSFDNSTAMDKDLKTLHPGGDSNPGSPVLEANMVPLRHSVWKLKFVDRKKQKDRTVSHFYVEVLRMLLAKKKNQVTIFCSKAMMIFFDAADFFSRKQGDQIGRIFAQWVIIYFGQFCLKLPK
jgi:hypothetical protein